MAEVFRDGIYEPLLRGKQDLTILDIGANIGITAYYFSQFAKQVYSLEPSLEHFDTFTTMLKYNKITNVIPINKAMYIKPGQLPLYHPQNENKTMYSLHAGIGVKDEELVTCTTFEELIN